MPKLFHAVYIFLPGLNGLNFIRVKKYSGGNFITAEAPFDVIPVFLRDNAHLEFVGVMGINPGSFSGFFRLYYFKNYAI